MHQILFPCLISYVTELDRASKAARLPIVGVFWPSTVTVYIRLASSREIWPNCPREGHSLRTWRVHLLPKLLHIRVASDAALAPVHDPDRHTVHPDIKAYNESQSSAEERRVCEALAKFINKVLPEAECKIWHRHPVWFLDENPIVGYSKLKAGIRLMFWSGASFDEDRLSPGTGKFEDASIIFSHLSHIDWSDMARWIEKSKTIQWDYKNVAKRKGKLVRIK